MHNFSHGNIETNNTNMYLLTFCDLDLGQVKSRTFLEISRDLPRGICCMVSEKYRCIKCDYVTFTTNMLQYCFVV